jgi:hypothetical protein
LLALLVLVPVLTTFQGLDFTDTGWVATSYQLIFVDPESVSYWFHMWLSNVIGGFVLKVTSSLGLLGLKLGAAAVFWASCVIVWRMLRSLVATPMLLAGMLLAYGFQFPRVPVVHYNSLTALFHFLAALFLLEGLRRDNAWLLVAAGAVEAANVFVRLPNVAGIALVLVIGYQALIDRLRVAKLGAKVGCFVGGYAAGLMAVLLAMAAAGHLGLYLESVKNLFRSTGSELSGYSTGTMLMMFVQENGKSVVAGAIVAAALAAAGALLRWRRIVVFILCAAGALFMYFVSVRFFAGNRVIMRAPLGFIYLPLLIALLVLPDAERNLKAAAFAALVVLLALSLGSDTGTLVSVYGYLLGFPLVIAVGLAAARSWRASKPRRLDLSALLSSWPAFFLFFVVICSIHLLVLETYRDSRNRLAMTTTVNHPMLKGIYTTPERARVANEVLAELSRRVRPGEVLLSLESSPMLNFATRTRPYLGNSWPDLYVGDELDEAIQWALKTRQELPLVVKATRDTRNRIWPKNKSLNQGAMSVANRERMQLFLDRFGYTIVWENDMFQILEPGRRTMSEEAGTWPRART